MNLKLVAAIAGFLVLVFVGYLVLANTGNKPGQSNLLPNVVAGDFDFGDAPDAKSGQQFPSLLASNGAHVKKTDEVWLGQKVTVEKDSKQINVDEADDGVNLKLSSCQQSTAYFFVHLKNPGQVAGTAYLNLYADWNKDGRWAGNDECAPEWAVQNYPIDLAQQTDADAVYQIAVTAGKNVAEFWYRGAITFDQKMDVSATGEFASGEIEDYGPKSPSDERYYNFYCLPDPLVINHGSKGDAKIVPDLFSEPVFDVQFGQNYNPKTDKRQAAINNNTFTFESLNKDVDPPKRSVPHFVDLKVRFGVGGQEATLVDSCKVIVEHDEITTEEPPGRRKVPPPESPQVLKPKTHPVLEAIMP